jgi:two-component system KDP operon response regulator KdpE
VRRFLRAALASRGYRLVEAGTIREAEQLATSHNPDVFLLDLGLPDGDGIDLVRRLRGWTRAPIVVLSARGREEDKVDALDTGADDYLTKPFGVNELLARLRVALRHAQEGPEQPAVLEAGPVRVDVARHEVTVDGREVRLTPTEFRLLALLARHAGKVLTHRQILREVWGPNATEAHYVRVHMAELRKKIEAEPARPKVIVTEPGVGYRLRDRVEG